MILKKQHIHYNRNVGGINFGTIDAILQVFECADGHNFDLRPIGGYKKRDGYERFYQNEFWDGIEIETEANGFPAAICFWQRPDTSKHILWYQSIDAGLPRGLVRPCQYHPIDPYPQSPYCYEEVPRGEYSDDWEYLYGF